MGGGGSTFGRYRWLVISTAQRLKMAENADDATFVIPSRGPNPALAIDDTASILSTRQWNDPALNAVTQRQLLRAGFPLIANDAGLRGVPRLDSVMGDREDDEKNSRSPWPGTPAAPPRRRVMAGNDAQRDQIATELVRRGTPIRQVKSSELEDMSRWYFHTQLEQDAGFFQSAQYHWGTGVFMMAQDSEPMFNAMAAFALHKKVALSETSSQAMYLEKKVDLIQSIQSDLSRTTETANSLTIVAIAMLAFFDIRDLQFNAAEQHLRAVCKFVDMTTLSVHAWLYCAWIDLRYALFTGKEPMLPYYVPRWVDPERPRL